MYSVGLFGGTFDPVHFGHLRTALELKQKLKLDEMRLLPSHLPGHRVEPASAALQRLNMVELAVIDEPELRVDDREVERQGISYMADTLASIRAELGEEISLCLVLGMDSFLTLPAWREWEKIPSLAHMIVVARPGSDLPSSGIMGRFLHARETADSAELKESPSGRVLVQSLTPLDISATAIRSMIACGESPRYLLPDSVWDYIRQQRLYEFKVCR